MKKEYIIIIICVFSISFFSCEGNLQKANIDSNDIKNITMSSIEESFLDTSYFKDPQIVVLETLDESLLTGITRMSMDDSILFVYDRQLHNIFMFDITGKYISKIDCKGEGPGEYIQLADFTIDTDKKQIILLCAIPERRMYFTYDGAFVKEERHHDFYSQLMMDSNYIYFEKTISGTFKDQLLILDTKTGEKQGGPEPIDIKNSFYIKGNSLNRGKEIYFVRRYDNSIYELANGKIIEKYHVDFKKHSFPDQLIAETETGVIMNECEAHEYIFSMSNVIDNDDFMMFYTNRGVFIYNKKNDVLTGYKQILNSKLNPILEYPFVYYTPLENTNKIVCLIDEPSFIKHISEQIIEYPNKMEVKKLKDKHMKLVEDIISIGNKMTEDNNPVLFIYEFKE